MIGQLVDREVGGPCRRSPETDLDQEFAHVFTFAGPGRRPVCIDFVISQQATVSLQMRTAPSRVSDDRIQSFDVELIQVAARKRPRSLCFTIMSMERSATRLNGRGVYFAPVG